MAPPSRPSQSVHFCVFDERRGEKEGHEAEKILAYHPSSVSGDVRAAVVGLTQAALTFTSTFQPDQQCSILNTEQKQWFVHCSVPHIYLLMVVERSWHKGPVRQRSMQSALEQLNQLLILLLGPLDKLLQKDDTDMDSGEAIQGVLNEFGSRLYKQRGAEYSRLHNPLASFDAVPLLRLPQSQHLGLQSLINGVLVSPSLSEGQSLGLMLMHESWLLWTTLSMEDTNSLYHLFSWSLLPAIKAASQTSLGRKLTRSNSVQPPGNRASLLQRNAWKLGNDGFLIPSQAITDRKLTETLSNAPATPLFWLQGSHAWGRLLVLQVMDEILMVVLPENGPELSIIAEGLVSVAAPAMKSQSNQIARHLQATRRDHIPSYRYLFTDDRLHTCKASPGNKVATLSRNSLSLASSVRADFEAEVFDEAKNQVNTAETAVWGQQDCWVVAKGGKDHQLYTVLEQHNKEGLIDACRAVDKFGQLHFEGLF